MGNAGIAMIVGEGSANRYAPFGGGLVKLATSNVRLRKCEAMGRRDNVVGGMGDTLPLGRNQCRCANQNIRCKA